MNYIKVKKRNRRTVGEVGKTMTKLILIALISIFVFFIIPVTAVSAAIMPESSAIVNAFFNNQLVAPVFFTLGAFFMTGITLSQVTFNN